MWDNPDNGGSVFVDVLTSLVNSLSSNCSSNVSAHTHTHTHTGTRHNWCSVPQSTQKEPSVPHNVQINPRFQTRSLTLSASYFFPCLLCVLWQNAQHHILSFFISSNLCGTENENGWNWNTGLKTESVHFALVLLSWFGIAKIIYFNII